MPVGDGLWEKCLRSVLGNEQEIMLHGDSTGEIHAGTQEVPHGWE